MELDDLLREVIMRESSDLHLKAGRPPLMRIHGQLLVSGHPPLDAKEVERLLFSIMTEAQINRFKEDLEADFSYELQGEARFRVNAFYQQGKAGMALALHESVPIRHVGIPGIMVHDSEEQAGHDLDARESRSEVGAAASCPISHLNHMPPHQSGLLLDEINRFLVCHMRFSVRNFLRTVNWWSGS